MYKNVREDSKHRPEIGDFRANCKFLLKNTKKYIIMWLIEYRKGAIEMGNISKKKLITAIFNACLIIFYSNAVFAVEVPEEVHTTLVDLTKILLLIGTAVCIGKVIHIGILYVTSTAVDKSNAKQALLPWIIGTIVCFGAATIGSAIIETIMNAGLPDNVLDY